MDETQQPREEDPAGLSPEELEAESAEALPERAAMSTLSVAGLDPAAGSVEAVGHGVSDAGRATGGAPVAPADGGAAAPGGTADGLGGPDGVATTQDPGGGDAGTDLGQ